MINIEKVEVFGWEAAIRGMRNPMNSWSKSDSKYENGKFIIGDADLDLMKRLSVSGPDHAKFMRFINVTADITAPLYMLKEFDTYKVGTVSNSCSTMLKIHSKEFELDDFSCEYLTTRSINHLLETIGLLNDYRNYFINYKEDNVYVEHDGQVIDKKTIWYQLIQSLPSSYNQKRTVQLNYAVLKNMYHARRNHKLNEWQSICDWIKTLPYAKELICNEK